MAWMSNYIPYKTADVLVIHALSELISVSKWGFGIKFAEISLTNFRK